MITPCPKTKPVRRNGKKYKEFRRRVCAAHDGLCAECGVFVPLYDCDGQFDVFTCGHVAHIKSHGAGGGDTIENAKWKCYSCHIEKEHGTKFKGR